MGIIINHSSTSVISGLWAALPEAHRNSTKSGLLHITAFLGENQFDRKEVGKECR